MASNTKYLSIDSPSNPEAPPPGGFRSATWKAIVTILTPLASLKITVVLFAMSIFIVYAGTVAQVESDIWQVVHDYFRMDLSSIPAALNTAFSWIELRMLFPRAFFPRLAESIPADYGFFFPNGWLIGLAMFINLTAAHLIRFRIQTRGTRLVAGLWVLVAGVALTLLVIMAGSYQTADRPQLFVDWPSLRILWLLLQCTAASAVLLAGCWLVFRKRAGIVLLHVGIGLLMFGELLVGVAAVESQMQIVEGQTVNFALDTRELELALIDRSDEDEDEVFAVPQSRLRVGEVVADEDLPVEIEPVRFMANSRLRNLRPKDKNLATAGGGRTLIADEVAQISGTDSSGRMNQPTIYVELTDKQNGESLGVYRLSLRDWMQGNAETIEVGGRELDMQLRYKHQYKPYSMHLIDVEQQVYVGTNTAKSYASELRLVDPERNVDRRVRIWMNNPLRYAGATFYQSNYGIDPASGMEYTGLQVVTNTGWRIPYVSCMMVVVGMMAQFGVTLLRYLNRLRSGRIAVGASTAAQPAPAANDRVTLKQPLGQPADSKGWMWIVPTVVVILCAGWFLSKLRQPSPSPSQPNYTAFGQLPVTFEGRIKPMDTLARTSLRKISDRQTYVDEQGDRQPAVRWLLDVITDSEAARKHRVFRIHNLDVQEVLGLQPRKGYRYAIEEFAPRIDRFEAQVRRARETPAEQRDLFATKVLELDRRLNEFLMLQEAFRLPKLSMDNLREDLAREANRRERFSEFAMPLAVPPGEGEGKWQPYTFALFDTVARRMAAAQGIDVGEANEATVALLGILSSYDAQGKNASTFNQKVQEYQQLLEQNPPEEWNPTRSRFEAYFNHVAPLYHAMVLYLFAGILGCAAWLGWTGPLRRASIWLCLFTWVVHTLALCARIYISGRPPITTLYTSTLFVGWFCVLLGLGLETFSRIGIANVVAAAAGFLALLIGYKMTTEVISFKGDTFTVLVAVLDTNFWLATHVTCVTAGYGATILAGLFGIVYVARGLLTPSLTPEMAKTVGRMVYGTICFALFFSFFGTVLGGLWADDSWGRFWGWDPKENGALIIVLWNAIGLHALWGRMVGDRGLAVLAIGGIIVTAWSWFGVNELGVGLHSYGFTEGVRTSLKTAVAGLLAVIAIGLIPQRYWISTLANRRGARV